MSALVLFGVLTLEIEIGNGPGPELDIGTIAHKFVDVRMFALRIT